MPLCGQDDCITDSPELFLDGSDHVNAGRSDFSLPWLIPKDPSTQPGLKAKKTRKACFACVMNVG